MTDTTNDPRELRPDEIEAAAALADRLYAGVDVRLPERLRAAYWLKLLCSDPRLHREASP